MYQLAYEVLQARGIKGAVAAKDKRSDVIGVVARMVSGVIVGMLMVLVMLVIAMVIAVVVFFSLQKVGIDFQFVVQVESAYVQYLANRRMAKISAPQRCARIDAPQSLLKQGQMVFVD